MNSLHWRLCHLQTLQKKQNSVKPLQVKIIAAAKKNGEHWRVRIG